MELAEALLRPAARSRRIWKLRRRLEQLAESFGIDTTFVPNDQKDVDRIHGLRVLAHAEIEEYIEQIVQTIIDVTRSQATRGRLTHSGHCLVVAFSNFRSLKRDTAAQAEFPKYASHLASQLPGSNPDLVRSALQQHQARVDTNHGIRSSNVKSLLMPLGFRDACFVPPLLDKLDELGEMRGAVAHSSGVGIQSLPSGSSELSRLVSLYRGLEILDRYVPRVLRPSDA